MRVGGEPLLAPAGWMATYLPFFGRISHWHRAGAVAALLLVPLVSLVPTLRPQRWIGPAIGALLLLDRIVGFPVGWPLPSTSGPDTEVYASLAEQKGAVLVLPTRFPDNLGPRARWRDPSLMAQLYHGHPISEAAAMGHKRASAGKHAGDLLQQLGKTGRVDRGHRDAFKGPGFVWLAVYNHHIQADSSRDRAWRSCLRGVVAQTAEVTLYKLDGGIIEQCLSGAQPTDGPLGPGAPQTF